MSDEKKKKNKRSGVIICGAYGLGNAGMTPFSKRSSGKCVKIDPDTGITVSPAARVKRRKDSGSMPYILSAFFLFGRNEKNEAVLERRRQSNSGCYQPQEPLVLSLHHRPAKILGNKVIMYGCGIGPVKHSYDRR
jgi:hypothetical protein